MERAADIQLNWQQREIIRSRATLLLCVVLSSIALSCTLASWLPLQFSVVTVFLFAGPHNLLEFRYFLTRMPVRLGQSTNFFAVAFGGIALLTLAYVTLPVLYYSGLWSGNEWTTLIAVWNTGLVLWIAVLIWMRGKLKRRDWFLAWPAAFVVISANWLAPELFSIGLVYLHPLIALWFLDRQLRRSRPEWLKSYHYGLAVLPIVIAGMCWYLSSTSSLPNDNGLAWRITQHAGADLLPRISTHLLVSVHVFLEMLHYLVWLIALPLLSIGSVWTIRSIPIAKHPSGFPKLITAMVLIGLFLVGLLWFGFSVDYSTTRDVYFAVAIAHVLAEAPFLLRML